MAVMRTVFLFALLLTGTTAVETKKRKGQKGKKNHRTKYDQMQDQVNEALQKIAVQHKTGASSSDGTTAEQSAYQLQLQAQQDEMRKQALMMVDKLKEQQSLLETGITTAKADMQITLAKKMAAAQAAAAAKASATKASTGIVDLKPSTAVLNQMQQLRQTNPFYSDVTNAGAGPNHQDASSGAVDAPQQQQQQQQNPMAAAAGTMGQYGYPNDFLAANLFNPNNYYVQQAILMQQAQQQMFQTAAVQGAQSSTMQGMQPAAMQGMQPAAMQGMQPAAMQGMQLPNTDIGGMTAAAMVMPQAASMEQSMMYPYQLQAAALLAMQNKQPQ